MESLMARSVRSEYAHLETGLFEPQLVKRKMGGSWGDVE